MSYLPSLFHGSTDSFLTQLFDTRRQICEEKLITPDRVTWEALLQLLIAIQTEGQSSDETEDEVRDLYHVRFWAWRSEQVTEILKYIDSHRETRNGYGNSLPGKPF